MIFWLICAALVALFLYPFLCELLRPRLSAKLKATAPGEFAELSQGSTHYQWLGAKEGPVAVCVHGLTTPSYVYGPLAEGLGEMGYRVLVYDLYGRGYSNHPKGEQDSAFFEQQLIDLLEHQKIKEPVLLAGYSMGGAIVASFTASYPDRVSKLILLAAAGLGHDLGPLAAMANNYNWLGRWMVLGFYPKSLRRATEAERGLESAIPDIVDKQIAATKLKGFAPAVLASLRGILDEDLEEAHRKIASADVPVLAVWGEEDDVIPLDGKENLVAWNPSAENAIVAEAGHTVVYTHTEATLEPIRAFLSK